MKLGSYQQQSFVIAALLMTLPVLVATQTSAPIKWREALKQKKDWFGSEEAIRIADNLLAYQCEVGGWPKNIDMAQLLSPTQKATLEEEKNNNEATIDNDATYTQLAYLGRVFEAKRLDRHRDAFLKGFDYLLKAQYENGGWPQYYPNLTGYYKHITYNDNAMVGVLQLLREISAGAQPYTFVDEKRRQKASRAIAKGIECILRTQIVINGLPTVWCAQHDEVTLAPAQARKYELPSLSGGESVGVVRFLMGVEKPNAQIREAITSAIAWFEKSKLTGIRWVEEPLPAGGFNRVVVKDPNAGPLWARFYEISTNRPIFVGRDSVIHYDVSEIEAERRNGYAWYVTAPAKLIEHDYPAWQKMWGANN